MWRQDGTKVRLAGPAWLSLSSSSNVNRVWQDIFFKKILGSLVVSFLGIKEETDA